jgi:hypothetical protein
MSKDSSNVPNLKEDIKNALAGGYQPQWTLENDYEGASAIHVIHGSGQAAPSGEEPARGHGEIAKYESYGEWGIGGPPNMDYSLKR